MRNMPPFQTQSWKYVHDSRRKNATERASARQTTQYDRELLQNLQNLKRRATAVGSSVEEPWEKLRSHVNLLISEMSMCISEIIFSQISL